MSLGIDQSHHAVHPIDRSDLSRVIPPVLRACVLNQLRFNPMRYKPNSPGRAWKSSKMRMPYFLPQAMALRKYLFETLAE